MREVLASIPGLSVKPRRRSNKKLTTAAQIEQFKDGKVDLETPDSILSSTNLRALLNKQTFSLLPPLYQHNLIQLLPSVDREASEVLQPLQPDQLELPSTSSSGGESAMGSSHEAIRLSASCLNNEFFSRACLEWRERLSEGEFTPENQIKLKTETEREKNKLDPWKLKHFEPYWGEKNVKRALNPNPPPSKLKLEPSLKQQQQPVPPATATQQKTQQQQQQLQQATCDNETELKLNMVSSMMDWLNQLEVNHLFIYLAEHKVRDSNSDDNTDARQHGCYNNNNSWQCRSSSNNSSSSNSNSNNNNNSDSDKKPNKPIQPK